MAALLEYLNLVFSDNDQATIYFQKVFPETLENPLGTPLRQVF